MAQLPSAFNTKEHEGMGDFSAIPAGKYIAEITNSEKMESKNKKGNFYWKLTFDVISDEEGSTKYKGRKLFVNLNLINSNAQAVEIANNELKTICEACGKVSIQDTAELHKTPMLVTVKVTPATAQYPEGNSISYYKAVSGIASPNASKAAASEDEPAAPKKRAWEE